MPRPLKILKDIVEENPSATRNKINGLLGKNIKVAEDALTQLSVCLHLLLNKDRASAADQAIVDLGIRFWNDIRAANILIREGFFLNATMIERDAIEIMVVAEYLHKYPEEAEAWQKAKTLKERLHFGIDKLKNTVEGGNEWKELFDDLSSYIHPNRQAVVAYSRSKPFCGYALYLGSFYDPAPIASSFLSQLAICINFIEYLIKWYKADLAFPDELLKRIERLGELFHTKSEELKKRAHAEQQKINDKIQATRLSGEEIIKLFKFLDTLP